MGSFTQTYYILPDEHRFVSEDPATGEVTPIAIPYVQFYALYETIREVGIETAHTVALYGAQLVRPDLSAEEAAHIRKVVQSVHHAIYSNGYPNQTEIALALTYGLLQEKHIGWKEAAVLATDMIGRPISHEAWRKTVERWAEREGLQKVAIYKRSETKTDK